MRHSIKYGLSIPPPCFILRYFPILNAPLPTVTSSPADFFSLSPQGPLAGCDAARGGGGVNGRGRSSLGDGRPLCGPQKTRRAPTPGLQLEPAQPTDEDGRTGQRSPAGPWRWGGWHRGAPWGRRWMRPKLRVENPPPPPPSSVRVSRCSSPTPGTATHSGGGAGQGGDASRIPPVLRTQRQACKGETPHTVNI